jgi:radical SAM superfamily enzyme
MGRKKKVKPKKPLSKNTKRYLKALRTYPRCQGLLPTERPFPECPKKGFTKGHSECIRCPIHIEMRDKHRKRLAFLRKKKLSERAEQLLKDIKSSGGKLSYFDAYMKGYDGRQFYTLEKHGFIIEKDGMLLLIGDSDEEEEHAQNA